MKITDKVLSIPPYISSPWKNIASLHVEPRPFGGHALMVELVTGTKVEIPNLDRPVIEEVFACHAKALENDSPAIATMTATIPFSSAFAHLQGLTSIIQHNAEQKDSPLLPPELLEKVVEMTKGLLPQDTSSMEQPELGCNCPHCQVMRAVLKPEAEIEENVTDEDLKFRTWDIKQENDQLYSVTNPLDHKEHYNVFLGKPLGCSCGNNNCEHIQAVLKS